MRILQIIDTLVVGGAERMAVNISNALNDNGHKSYLCSTRGGGQLKKFIKQEVDVLVLQKKHSVDLSSFYKLSKYIKKERIEIVHAHSSSVYWAVLLKFGNPELKVIWHDHFGMSEMLKDSDRKVLKIISPFIDGIIAVNGDLHAWSDKNMKVESDKILFVNNFPLIPEKVKQTNSEKVTIVCLANLRPQKDHHTLVKAIDLLFKQNTELNLKVIFAGLYQQDQYYNSLNELIKELNLQTIVEIVGPVEDTASLLSSADIGVLSSVSEGLPVSLLEYGMFGLPVVVTDVGQCSEVVDFGKYGKVVKPGDSEQLAAALNEIITNYKLSIQVGKLFKDFVVGNYGSLNFVKRYEALLSSISK